MEIPLLVKQSCKTLLFECDPYGTVHPIKRAPCVFLAPSSATLAIFHVSMGLTMHLPSFEFPALHAFFLSSATLVIFPVKRDPCNFSACSGSGEARSLHFSPSSAILTIFPSRRDSRSLQFSPSSAKKASGRCFGALDGIFV